jgi:hypothetical protein
MIDLRWGLDTSQDDFDEAQRRVLDACFSEIDRARPFFIGLLGDRYGTPPDPIHAGWIAAGKVTSGDRDLSGMSVTELEFGHAFLWRTEAPADRASCITVLAREAAENRHEVTLDRQAERARALLSKVEKLARTRADIHIARYRAYQLDKHHTTNSAQSGRHHPDPSFVDLVVDSISPRLLAHAADLASTDLTRATKEMFRERHPLVVGREPFVRELEERLAESGPVRVGIFSPWGFGKSALAVAMEAQLQRQGRLVVSVFVGTDTATMDNRDIMIEVASEIARHTGARLAIAPAAHTPELIRWWKSVLEIAALQLHDLTIIIDGWNRVFGDNNRDDPSLLLALPEKVGVLLTTSNEDQVGMLAREGYIFYQLGPLHPHEAAEAAQAWSMRQGRTLPRDVLTTVGREVRSPAWVRQAVALLEKLGADDFAGLEHSDRPAQAIAEMLSVRVGAMSEYVEDLIAMRLADLDRRVGRRSASLALGLLGCSYVPLSMLDLQTLMAGHIENPVEVAATLRNMLDDALWEVDEEGGLRFAHLVYMDACRERASPDVRGILARAAIARGTRDDHERWDLMVQISLADVGSVPSESAVFADLINAGEPVGTSQVLLALTTAPRTRILGILKSLESSRLDEQGMATLSRASRSTPDPGFPVTPSHRRKLERAVKVIQARRSRYLPS